uniref:Reverse transcriptase/retrotransposon-derived protein RNase H-like domain-containing protein n=1 Tax=Tanacetum cinerariifolium TaxID=118510 RepID=A0A699JSI7_TANCI|nr:hypothetical protein [Tanacetum cinerariifolium]
MLFDFRADKSFVDIKFSHLIDIKPVKLNSSYEVKLADIKVVSTNSVLRGCTLNLLDHLFNIDIMPIELGTFDVIAVMDWLVERDALIVCARKYIERGSQLFIAQVTEKEPAKKQLQDVPVICNFPQVFPDDLPGLPPPRQVEFKIELIPGAAPVAIINFKLEKKISQSLHFGIEQGRSQETLEDHLELLKNEKLYAKILKCDFWFESVQFLCHVIDNNGIHIDPAKVEAIRNWSAPTRRIEGMEEEEAFTTLKQKLCSAPILALPEGTENLIVYCDVSLKGFGAVLMQREKAFPLPGESSHWQYKFPLSLHCCDEETASQREMAVTLRRWHTSCP